MAHGSKMIARLAEEASAAASLARHMAPTVGAALGQVGPGLEMETYIRSIADRILVLRDKLDAAHLHRFELQAASTFATRAVREAAKPLKDILCDVRYYLDRACGKGEGLSKFEGRSDLTRIPLITLEHTAQVLLNMLTDPKFEWERRARIDMALPLLRKRLAETLADFQEARNRQRAARSKVFSSHMERKRVDLAEEREIRRLIALLRSLLNTAGHDLEARTLKQRRSRSRRSPQRTEKPQPQVNVPTPAHENASPEPARPLIATTGVLPESPRRFFRAPRILPERKRALLVNARKLPWRNF